MPNFARLLTGGGEALSRAQAELQALGELGYSAEEIQQIARNFYGGQHLGGLTIYHGSPYAFDKFDFLRNLSRGEGRGIAGRGQAFGPGGYLTGDRDLAAEYARNLTNSAQHTMLTPPRLTRLRYADAPSSWTAGAKNDALGFLEYLRARSIAKALGVRGSEYGVGERYGHGSRLQLRPTSDDFVVDVPDTNYFGVPKPGGRGYWDKDKFEAPVRRTVELRGLKAYEDALREVLPRRKGAVSLATPLIEDTRGMEAAELGRMIMDQVRQNGGITPSARSWTARVGEVTPVSRYGAPDSAAHRAWQAVHGRPRPPDWYNVPNAYQNIGVLNLLGRQLRAVEQGSLGRVPRGQREAKYKASMDSAIDLKQFHPDNLTQDKLNAIDVANELRAREYAQNLMRYEEYKRNPPPAPQPHIYTAETSARPEDMFSYDLPLNATSPRVLGALSELYNAKVKKMSLQDFSKLRGEEVITQLNENVGPHQTITSFRDAGVPAMYFRRAGHRPGDDAILRDPRFDPAQHNFVWFDDDLLKILKREHKREGGLVTA